MCLSEFKKLMSLHDSGLDSWQYNSADQTIIARIELCDQPGYEWIDDMPVSGTLKFTGASGIQSDPSKFEIDGLNNSGEILQFDVESSSCGKPVETFKLVFLLHNYPTRTHHTIVVWGKASDVSFIRDTR